MRHAAWSTPKFARLEDPDGNPKLSTLEQVIRSFGQELAVELVERKSS